MEPSRQNCVTNSSTPSKEPIKVFAHFSHFVGLVSTTVLGSGSLLNQRFELFNAIAKGIKFDGQTSLAETG